MTTTTKAWAVSAWEFSKKYSKLTVNRYRKLRLVGKLIVWLWILFYLGIVAAFIVITPAGIAQYLHDRAKELAQAPFGWLVLWMAIIFICFPPLIGHSTLSTLCGFAYGMKGCYISMSASLVGSAMVFLILRALFGQRLRAWSSQNPNWTALEAVVKAKGLPLIILIRASPFPPWVYSNSLFASIDSVALWQFSLATFFTFPKLVLHAFVGSKMAQLADGDERGRMDTHTKILNGVFIGISVTVAFVASWLVYTSVQKHIRTMEEFPSEVDQRAADAIEDFDEDAPLLTSSPTHV